MPRSRAGIVVQARMGSSRLPGKVLMDICGRTLLERVVLRLRHVRGAQALVVAVPHGPRDDRLAEAARALGVDVARGPEDDVLERLARAGEEYGLTTLMRVTCDNPLVCPELATQVLAAHCAEGLDYTSNRNESGSGIPDGAGVEVYSMSALLTLRRRATRALDREHVNEYVFRHPQGFRTRILPAPEQCRMPDLRLTVDTARDLACIRALHERLAAMGRPEPYTLADVVAAAREGAAWA